MENKIRVQIVGLNLSRLIERLIKENVFIENLTTKKKSITFTIYEKDLQKLKYVCNIEHKKFVVIKRNGRFDFIKKIPYYFGAIVAIIISICYMLSYNGIIYKVNLCYESSFEYDLSNVKRVMNDNNIISGMRKNKITSSEIEKIILQECNDISGCSAKFTGGVLDICVYPAVKKYEKNLSDITSKYDAVIVSAEAYVGKLQVKPGDIVKHGDVLIKNSDGAKGEIQGKVYFIGSLLFNENQKEYQKTGQKITKSYLMVFNKYLTKSKRITEFSSYFEEKCDFFINNSFLPIKKQVVTYYETVVVDKFVSFSEVEEDIKKQAYSNAKEKLPSGVVEDNVTYSIVRDGNYVKVDCYLEKTMSLI